MKKPFLYFTISFCLGILSGSYFDIPRIYLFSFVIFFIFSALFSLKRKITSHVSLYLAIFFLGFTYYQISNTLPNGHISRLTPQEAEEVVLKGIIVDYPIVSTTFYRTEKTSFVLKVDSFESGSGSMGANGLVKVNLYGARPDARPDFGDEVVLKGAISRPGSFRNPGLFDYAKYLERNDIYSVLSVKDGFSVKILRRQASGWFRDSAYAARHVICDTIDRFFDRRHPDNGFLKAILVGDRSALKDDIEEDFIKTGTVHILSVSGAHVGLIACIFLFTFGMLNIPKKTNIILTASLLIFYSFVAGLNPPIVRSTIMFAIFAIGYLIGREGHMLNTLFLAAFVMLLAEPKALFDPGFQLSFSSIAAILILSPRIEGLFRLDRPAKRSVLSKVKLYIMKAVSVSVAAWLGVAPIVGYYFNIVSPVTVIANLIIVPAVFLVMMISFTFLPIAVSAAYFSSLTGSGAIPAILNIPSEWLAWMIRFFDHALFAVNHILAKLPLSFFRTGAPSLGFFAVYYLALAVFVFPKMREALLAALRRKHAYLALLLFLNLMIWRDISCHKDGPLRMTFLDVGNGDSALIELPKGGTILIDGGSGGSSEKLDMGKFVVAPYLWKRGITKLDAVIVTHFHEDHLGGLLYILDNFKVGCVIDNGTDPSSGNALYARYKKIIGSRHIRRISAGAGDRINSFPGAALLFLSPGMGERLKDSNENSLVMKLVCGGSSALFAGDIEDNGLFGINPYGEFLKADILKFPHHGGVFKDTDALKTFLRNVSPGVSVISGGQKGSRYNSTLRILADLSLISYYTREDGAVIVSIDGNCAQVKTGRGKSSFFILYLDKSIII